MKIKKLKCQIFELYTDPIIVGLANIYPFVNPYKHTIVKLFISSSPPDISSRLTRIIKSFLKLAKFIWKYKRLS